MEVIRNSVGFTMIFVWLAVQVTEAGSLKAVKYVLNEMPKNCSKKTFCTEKHEHYAQERIDELLNQKYNLMLARDEPDTSFRDGLDNEYKSMCNPKVATYAPIYEIIDEKGQVRQVVQSPKLFQQIIRIEECETQVPIYEEWHIAADDKNRRFNITCEGKTIDYSFLVLTPDGNDVEFIKNKGGVPCCCTNLVQRINKARG